MVAVLPPVERDRYWQRIIRTSGLSTQHQAQLQQRPHVTPSEVAALATLVFTWQGGDPYHLPANFPGSDGKGHLRRYPRTWAIAIPDHQGQIIGAQLKNPDGGYQWASSSSINGAGPHLANGELPLGLYGDRTPGGVVYLAEGFLKPALAAARYGNAWIGAAGGNWAGGREQLRAALERLQPQQVVLAPDGGATNNPHVLRQYAKVQSLLEDWGYPLKVLWWHQTTKGAGDVDEIAPEIFHQAGLLEWAQFETHFTVSLTETLPPQPRLNPLEVFHRRRATQRRPKALGPSVTYSPGGRLTAWAQTLQKRRLLLDQSIPGLGKSHDSGLITPEPFQVEKLLYVSVEHHNPTTHTLTTENGWVDLEARHSGLVRDKQGKLRRASRHQDQYPVSPNCGRSQLAAVLRDKNIAGADTAGRLCGGCPVREACQHSRGYGYGFLYERRNALAATKLRCHPDSLPSPEDFDYSKTLILWDEPEVSLNPTQEIQVLQGDVEAAIARLAIADRLPPDLRKVFEVLLHAMTGATQIPRYGLPLEALRQQLGTLPDALTITRAVATLSPDRDLEPILNPTAEYGVDIADLTKQLRRAFTERDYMASEKAQANVLKQWVEPFFAILQGQRGHLTLTRSGLHLVVANDRPRAIVQAAAGVIFLDATLSSTNLALALGIAPEEIATLGQEIPKTENLSITQVVDMGRMGQQRGEDKLRRLEALIQHYRAMDPTTAVIDFKKFEADGAWWRESRGVNDFTDCNTLVLAGTPCPNLNSVRATYVTLTGDTDENGEGFTQYLEAKIQSEFTQAIGRLRAHRRPDHPLQVVIISDVDIGCPTEAVEAVSVTPEAGSKTQRVELAIKAAIATLQQQGMKVTQQAIATLTSYSQGYISRFRSFITNLLETLNRKVIIPPEGSNLDQETVSALLSGIVSAAKETDSLAVAVADLVDMAISPHELAAALPDLPIPHQSRLWIALATG